MLRKKNDVTQQDAIISAKGLKRPKAVSEFLHGLNAAINKGYKEIILDFKDGSYFPNAVTPIAGIIQYYTVNKNITFKLKQTNVKAVNQTNMLNPRIYDEQQNILGKVWKFDSFRKAEEMVDAYMVELKKSDRFPEGTIKALQWSLNEVMDNVINHSNVGFGYVMGQIHTSSKRIAFTVFDVGQGILKSFEGSEHHPKDSIDAITLAIKEAVTSDKDKGQGNGLFGLHSIIKQGNGNLVITSGQGCFMYIDGESRTYHGIPQISKDAPATIVDFQLDYSSDVRLDKALLINGKEYKIVDWQYENMLDDEERVVYSIKDHSEGTGTRDAAKRTQNEIMNILSNKPKKLILDFSGVPVISSSFADELIAKLILELGIFHFNNLITLRGMDYTNQNILQRSVIQRLIEIVEKKD